MKSIHHMCVNVRGMIRNRHFGGLQDKKTGRYLTHAEAFEALCDELAKGHEVIPMGEPCEGFDYSGGGCPGHPVADEDDDDATRATPEGGK